jgi:hypothetical protein
MYNMILVGKTIDGQYLIYTGIVEEDKLLKISIAHNIDKSHVLKECFEHGIEHYMNELIQEAQHNKEERDKLNIQNNNISKTADNNVESIKNAFNNMKNGIKYKE